MKGVELILLFSVKSGDVLQFGVDVDNNPKQTYSCVVSQIRCHHPDGTEVEFSPNSVNVENYQKVDLFLIQNLKWKFCV